jgi:hypothetical protein
MLAREAVVQSLLSLSETSEYLEIGVYAGSTFFAVEADHKVAVDPKFQFDVDAQATPGSVFYEVTSDEYFGSIIEPDKKFDLIFLDGLHTLEQTLRDFTNAIEYLKPNGIILIDDIMPNSYVSSLATMELATYVREFFGITDGAWMGDTYKVAFFIDTFFQQYRFCTVADNQGQLVVWKERRPSVAERSVESVGRLQVDQLVVNYSVMNTKPLSEIMKELRQRAVT